MIAESGDGCARTFTLLAASMEPRSCDRGKLRVADFMPSNWHASMEPRSCDRGKTEGQIMAITAQELQWSRDHVIAERWLTEWILAIRRYASMEPRSCDRGKKHMHELAAARDDASMEPRSCDRGKLPIEYDDAPPVRLQWSRDHVIAERSQRRRHRRS